MINSKFYFILLFCLCCCKQKPSNNFNDEINKYNYLDKEYEFPFIYDFKDLLTKVEEEELIERFKNIDSIYNIKIAIIINDQIINSKNLEKDTRVINDILSKKFNFSKMLTMNILLKQRFVGISYTQQCSVDVNEEMINRMIDSILKPNFKNQEFYEGIYDFSNEFY